MSGAGIKFLLDDGGAGVHLAPVDPPFALSLSPTGRFRCWGVLMATPGLWYHGEYHEFSVQDLEAFVAHHTELKTAHGFTPPIIVVHDPSLYEGRRLGDVDELHLVQGKDGETYLLAVLEWALPSAEDHIRTGEFKYLSPGIGGYDDDTGRERSCVIREVSVCPSPHQKRLGRTNLLMMEGEDMEEMKAVLEALQAQVAELLAWKAESQVEAEEPAEGEKPEEEPMAAEEENVSGDLAEALGDLAGRLGLSEEHQALVKRLALTDVKLATDLIPTLMTAGAKPAPPAAPSTPSKVQGRKPANLQTQQSRNQAPPAPAPKTQEEAIIAARAKHPGEPKLALAEAQRLIDQFNL